MALGMGVKRHAAVHHGARHPLPHPTPPYTSPHEVRRGGGDGGYLFTDPSTI